MLKQENTDVIFEADEELFNSNKSSVVLIRKSQIRIPITKNRRFDSYCYEFCGRTQISFNTIRFLHAERDINPEQKLSSNFLVKIRHTAEFFIKWQNPLKQALNHLFTEGIFNDIILDINGEIQLKAHKCTFHNPFVRYFGSSITKVRNHVQQ